MLLYTDHTTTTYSVFEVIPRPIFRKRPELVEHFSILVTENVSIIHINGMVIGVFVSHIHIRLVFLKKWRNFLPFYLRVSLN